MNVVCHLFRHRPEVRLSSLGMRLTLGDVDSGMVNSFIQASPAITSARRVCTRCDEVIEIWDVSAVRKQDHEGGLVSVPRTDPDSVPAKFSDGVSDGASRCSVEVWSESMGMIKECNSKLLPDGSCPSSHHHPIRHRHG